MLASFEPGRCGMAFTFSVIEWASVIDPEGLFRKTGQSEGDIASGGTVNSSSVAFSSTGTSQIATADRDGNDDFPDDRGARLDQPVTLNGVSYQAGANVEADFELILRDPSAGLYFRATWLAINNQPVGVTISRGWNADLGRYALGPQGLYQPGTALTLIDGDTLHQSPNLADFTTNASFLSNGVGKNAQLNRNGAVVCFTAGTMIQTQDGNRPIQSLRVGDLVLTCDRGLRSLRWIGHRRIGAELLAAMPWLRPIRIATGAMGAGLPARDLLVSPQHRLLVRSAISRRMFGCDEVLVAACHLIGLPGIAPVVDTWPVDYWHFAFDRHELVWANGAPAEALYPGPQALLAVGPAARAELLTIFPELSTAKLPTARPFALGKRARHLADRHARNNRALLADAP